MMTFDKIYGQSAPTQPVVEELPQNEKGPPIYILHEAGLGSRTLGQGSTYNEMYANASQSMGVPEAELRKAGYKFSVEHQDILSVPVLAETKNGEARESTPASVAPKAKAEYLQDSRGGQALSKRQAAMAKARAVRMANLAARKAGQV